MAVSKRAVVGYAAAPAPRIYSRWGFRVSFGEPIALGGGLELEQAATAASGASRSTAETQFIERLQRGEAEAFTLLVSERSSEVYALLYRLTEDAEEARDLTQETFLRAFQSIGSFRGDASLKTWIYRIALNQARNRWRWWRRRRRDATISLDATQGMRDEPFGATLRDMAATDPEQDALAHERETALRAALKMLSRAYREAVILRDVEGLSYEEIAAALEISVGTVKSRISRGRLELRQRLGSSL